MKAAGRRLVIACFAFVCITVLMPPAVVHATTTQEKLNQAEKDKQAIQSKLNETKDNLNGLKETKNTLQGELGILNDQLTEVSDKLEELENQISDKEAEIEKTQLDLEAARETEKWQYDCMKKRIKFMYERSDYAYLEVLFAADNFSDFINKNSYVEQISEYDQKMLVQYKETRALIEKQEAELEQEKQDLDLLKEQVVSEQKKVSGLVSQTSSNISAYSGQISQAETEALAYEAKVAEQEANITYLKKKLAEEIALSKLAAQSTWRDISEVTFEEGDRYLLANIIYCEAGGEPYAGQLAVGAVVINRVLSSVYPNTVVGVVYQNRQFSPVASGRLALALAEGRATAACYKAADEAMAGNTNVGTCVYFRTPIAGLTGTQIGGHIFY